MNFVNGEKSKFIVNLFISASFYEVNDDGALVVIMKWFQIPSRTY